MEDTKINKLYKYLEKTSSFSYDVNDLDNYYTNIKLLNVLIKKGIKLDHIIAAESTDIGEEPISYHYNSIEEFIDDKEILTTKAIDKVVDYCNENGVKFEVHIMPNYSKVDIIFRQYRKENDGSMDSLISDIIKTK